MPTPQFKKWDNSSSVEISPLRPPPAAWYSFPLETTTALPCVARFPTFCLVLKTKQQAQSGLTAALLCHLHQQRTHFTPRQHSALTYSCALGTGPRELKRRKCRGACAPPPPPTFLLGTYYVAVHHSTIRDPEGEDPHFSLDPLMALPISFPRITSWNLKPDFWRCGSTYLPLGPSLTRSAVFLFVTQLGLCLLLGFQNQTIQCIGTHTYMRILKSRKTSNTRQGGGYL